VNLIKLSMKCTQYLKPKGELQEQSPMHHCESIQLFIEHESKTTRKVKYAFFQIDKLRKKVKYHSVKLLHNKSLKLLSPNSANLLLSLVSLEMIRDFSDF